MKKEYLQLKTGKKLSEKLLCVQMPSAKTVLWNLQSDVWKPIMGYGEKGYIFC